MPVQKLQAKVMMAVEATAPTLLAAVVVAPDKSAKKQAQQLTELPVMVEMEPQLVFQAHRQLMLAAVVVARPSQAVTELALEQAAPVVVALVRGFQIRQAVMDQLIAVAAAAVVVMIPVVMAAPVVLEL
jgi:hypothetical protein